MFQPPAPARKPRPVRLLPDRRTEGRRIAAALEIMFRDRGHSVALAALPLALAGDPAAAVELLAAAPDALRGHCAVALHLHDVPPATMRATLAALASPSLADLPTAVPNVGRLAAMCRHAETEGPADLPETFTVFRGVRDMGIKRGAKGLDWTLDRAAACWDATCDNAGRMYPMVLTATARRQDVGLRIGDDLVLYRVNGTRGDREGTGPGGWRDTGMEYRSKTDPLPLARRRGAQPEQPDAAPTSVEQHVQAIGTVLAAESAADAIGTLFNTYTELPMAERDGFVLAMAAELAVSRAAAAA